MSLDRENVRVLYEGICDLNVHAQRDNYVAVRGNGFEPTEFIMTMNDIIYVNSTSSCFKNGTLYFRPEDEEEIYKELKIRNYQDIMKDHDYVDILKKPTVEGLQKIININNSSEFERIRAILFRLKDVDSYSISYKVEELVSARYKELQNRKRVSDIIVQDGDAKTKVSNEEVNEIKQQNEALQNQLAQMQKMMEQLMQNQAQQMVKEEPTEKEENKTVTKKSVGRPSTKRDGNTK